MPSAESGTIYATGIISRVRQNNTEAASVCVHIKSGHVSSQAENESRRVASVAGAIVPQLCRESAKYVAVERLHYGQRIQVAIAF